MQDSRRSAEDRAVQQTLQADYCPPLIHAAREQQDALLLARFQGLPLKIADIGCGTGYHGALFGPACRRYHGFEIAPELAAIARQRWQADGLNHAQVFLGDNAFSTGDFAPLRDDTPMNAIAVARFPGGDVNAEPEWTLAAYTDTLPLMEGKASIPSATPKGFSVAVSAIGRAIRSSNAC